MNPLSIFELCFQAANGSLIKAIALLTLSAKLPYYARLPELTIRTRDLCMPHNYPGIPDSTLSPSSDTTLASLSGW